MQRIPPSLAALLSCAGLASLALADIPGTTIRVSVGTGNVQGNGQSGNGFGQLMEVSEDGRFTAFTSFASNLVPGDTNGQKDVFVHDSLTSTTIRASIGHVGQEGNGRCDGASVSADGRFVAFQSEAGNMHHQDANGLRDIFLFDRVLQVSLLVSRGVNVVSANGNSEDPSLSADGRYVCFWSAASDIVPGDTNGVGDIFVWDRIAGTTQRVSEGVGAVQATGPSRDPHISRDGRFVVFLSSASNLVPGDTNGLEDVFRKDLQTGQILRASGNPEWNGTSQDPHISANGRWVVFASGATNIVPSDTNFVGDVFLWDAPVGAVTRVSVATDGSQGNGASDRPTISADGQWVSFRSAATNLVAGDTNSTLDIFVTSLAAGYTERVSLDSSGAQAGSATFAGHISGDGRWVALLTSFALVGDDTNGAFDVFLRDRELGSGNFGAPYCDSNPSSAGVQATLRALQSPVVLDNNLLFVVEDLPPNQVGYMLMSAEQGFVPLFSGSQGNLCLAPPIVRFNQSVLSTGSGVVDFLPDLFALPQGTTVLAGEGWNFQFWFRDQNPSNTSNTSQALCVVFQ